MATSFAQLRVVNCVSQQDLEHLRHLLRAEDWHVFELDGTAVRDKASFFRKAVEQLPHETGLVANNNWDALIDVLWGSLAQIDAPRVAFLWTHAHNMLERGLPDLLMAVDCFQHLASEVAITEHGFPYAMTLRVFLVGEGDNFKPLQSGKSGEGAP